MQGIVNSIESVATGARKYTRLRSGIKLMECPEFEVAVRSQVLN